MATTDYRGDKLRVQAQKWLEVLETEYLNDFVPSGGSVVKVVSGTKDTLIDVEQAVCSSSERHGFHYVKLDPGVLTPEGKRPDLHRIERFFFEATREVKWTDWAEKQVRTFLEGTPAVVLSPNRQLNDLDGIADDSGLDSNELRARLERQFYTPLIRDHGQEIEFRTALTALSRAQILPNTVTPTTEEVIHGWFTGMPGLTKDLKKLHIFSQINITNARDMLASFCRWLPSTGRSGLVTVLDFRPYERVQKSISQRRIDTLDRLRDAVGRAASQNELAAIIAEGDADPPVSYSPNAYDQVLQLLRRFIDEIEYFERFCLVVLTSPSYYVRSSERNYFDYNALQTRIGLEVHDKTRANPFSALAHLEGDR